MTVVSLSGLGVIVGNYAECIREGISIPVVINLSCCALCLFGLLLAELWVFMAKGSKEWFEKYESAICKVVEEYSYQAFDEEVVLDDIAPKEKKVFCESQFFPRHGYLPENKRGKFIITQIETLFYII